MRVIILKRNNSKIVENFFIVFPLSGSLFPRFLLAEEKEDTYQRGDSLAGCTFSNRNFRLVVGRGGGGRPEVGEEIHISERRRREYGRRGRGPVRRQLGLGREQRASEEAAAKDHH